MRLAHIPNVGSCLSALSFEPRTHSTIDCVGHFKFAESNILIQPSRLTLPPVHGQAIALCAFYNRFVRRDQAGSLLSPALNCSLSLPSPVYALSSPQAWFCCSRNHVLCCHAAVLVLMRGDSGLYLLVRPPSCAYLPHVIAGSNSIVRRSVSRAKARKTCIIDAHLDTFDSMSPS
jgi:hypothetical protein